MTSTDQATADVPVPAEFAGKARFWQAGHDDARADHPKGLPSYLKDVPEAEREAARAAYFDGWEAGKSGPAR